MQIDRRKILASILTISVLTLSLGADAALALVGALTLQGTSESARLSLRSSSDGNQWHIDPQGSRNVSFVDVKDSNNLNATFVLPTSAINAGNNLRWFAQAVQALQDTKAEVMKTLAVIQNDIQPLPEKRQAAYHGLKNPRKPDKRLTEVKK